ncbi:MAG: hypothetical protein IT364_26205 [Candidatus Hydrogenedentes bacterium]|nr:hypothetical protein [Candidatus Hydrogenedentota bacterium]
MNKGNHAGNGEIREVRGLVAAYIPPPGSGEYRSLGYGFSRFDFPVESALGMNFSTMHTGAFAGERGE